MYGQPASNSFLQQTKSNDANENIPAWKLELQRNRAKKENDSNETTTPSWKTNQASNGPVKSWNKPETPLKPSWQKPAETPTRPAWQKPKPIVPTNKPVNKPWEKPAEKHGEPTPPKPAWNKPKPMDINDNTETTKVTKPWENPKSATMGNQRNWQTANSATPPSNVPSWGKKQTPPSPVEKNNTLPRNEEVVPPWRIGDIPRSNSSSSTQSSQSSRPNSFLSQNGGQGNENRLRINSFNVSPQINPPPVPTEKPKANKQSFLHKPAVKPIIPTTPPIPTKSPQRKVIPDHKSNLPAPAKPNKPGFVQVRALWVASNESIAKLPPGSKNKRFLPVPNAGGAPPLPPLPASDLPPPLPGRSPLPSPGHVDLPPIPPADDTYDDTNIAPPPLPPPNNRIQTPQEPEQIETWEDEEDTIYDETADSGDQPTFSGEGEGEDLYEAVETCARPKVDNEKDERARAKEDEKRNKEKKKKEKELRKKYNIKEEEIRVECEGTVKSSSKGGGKDLAVQPQQKIEIIRMHDNPKGKWLVRNLEGKYGYVESENIDVNTNVVKDQMRSFRQHQPFPSTNFPPPQIEEEVIYDETAEAEDVYEEM